MCKVTSAKIKYSMKSARSKLLLLVVVFASCNAILIRNETQELASNKASATALAKNETRESKSLIRDSLYVYDIINFSSGSSLTSAKQNKMLKELSQLLIENDGMRLSIEGHTHSDGKESSNLTLSTQRAKAVYDFLILEGINSSRMSYIGYGEDRPKESNETAYGKLQNSRVEIVVVD